MTHSETDKSIKSKNEILEILEKPVKCLTDIIYENYRGQGNEEKSKICTEKILDLIQHLMGFENLSFFGYVDIKLVFPSNISPQRSGFSFLSIYWSRINLGMFFDGYYHNLDSEVMKEKYWYYGNALLSRSAPSKENLFFSGNELSIYFDENVFGMSEADMFRKLIKSATFYDRDDTSIKRFEYVLSTIMSSLCLPGTRRSVLISMKISNYHGLDVLKNEFVPFLVFFDRSKYFIVTRENSYLFSLDEKSSSKNTDGEELLNLLKNVRKREELEKLLPVLGFFGRVSSVEIE